MIYLDIILKLLGILSLLTFMVIIIWGFVVFNSIYSQLRYSNYILEKISHILNISCIDMQVKEKDKRNLNCSKKSTSKSLDTTKVNESNESESIVTNTDDDTKLS